MNESPPLITEKIAVPLDLLFFQLIKIQYFVFFCLLEWKTESQKYESVSPTNPANGHEIRFKNNISGSFLVSQKSVTHLQQPIKSEKPIRSCLVDGWTTLTSDTGKFDARALYSKQLKRNWKLEWKLDQLGSGCWWINSYRRQRRNFGWIFLQ